AASRFYAVLGIKMLSDGVLIGAGAMKSFMTATFSVLLLRVALSYALVPHQTVIGALTIPGAGMGFNGFLWAWPIGWGLSAMMSLWCYRRGNWRDTAFSEALGSKKN
ncbi:MAG: hypothetical protein K2J72_04345, partial [Oscillospiraceae bacterium]|nr:hypothetical protein [Oscillospiraceae bacterium]